MSQYVEESLSVNLFSNAVKFGENNVAHQSRPTSKINVKGHAGSETASSTQSTNFNNSQDLSPKQLEERDSESEYRSTETTDGHSASPPAICSLCTECRRFERSVVLIPCGHLVLCDRCAWRTLNCPVCHSQVLRLLRSFQA